MKISFKIKEILYVNIPENSKRIRTGFDKIQAEPEFFTI